jgi:hypothetical protein
MTVVSRVWDEAANHGVQALRGGQLLRLTALLSLLVGCGDIGMDGAIDADFDGEESLGETHSALSVISDQSLLITATSVTRNPTRTEDPCSTTPGDENKVWTMGHLLKREAEKRSVAPSTYVSSWMNSWTSTSTVQGQTIPPLLGPMVRDNWNAFAGGSTALPLHKAPFWLLAIVNRIDLRKHRPLGEPLGGELRFVFGFLGPNGNNPPCPTTGGEAEAAMILEYSPNKGNENEVRDYARRWLDLSNMTMGTSEYRAALQVLTEEVVNNGKLLRIRTNEFRFGDHGKAWDLAEFEHENNLLRRSTVKQAPTMALIGGSQKLSDWIWSNRDALFANAFDYEVGRVGNRAVTSAPIGSYSVPLQFDGGGVFRGGVNTLGDNLPSFWSGPTPTGLPSAQLGAWADARFRFSVGTCSGCHTTEGGTSILHILPAAPGNETFRSPLLSGSVDITDPTDGTLRQFNEMWRRENDLRNLVNGAPVTNPVFGNNYTVRFKGSNKCLDSSGNTTGDGALSQLYSCHGNSNQRLALHAVSPGVYNLKYKHSQKCIDVQNASTSNGALVEQRACSSARNSQKLTLSTLSGVVPYTRVLKFQHSNLCLLVQNQASADATPIIQGTCPSSSEFSKGFDLVE